MFFQTRFKKHTPLRLNLKVKTTRLKSTQIKNVCKFYNRFSTGPPDPPLDIKVDEVTETTSFVSWSPGPDNHSPVFAYNIQIRSPFSLGWQAAKTGVQELIV